MKATRKNGNTSAKIQFARAWCTAEDWPYQGEIVYIDRA